MSEWKRISFKVYKKYAETKILVKSVSEEGLIESNDELFNNAKSRRSKGLIIYEIFRNESIDLLKGSTWNSYNYTSSVKENEIHRDNDITRIGARHIHLSLARFMLELEAQKANPNNKELVQIAEAYLRQLNNPFIWNKTKDPQKPPNKNPFYENMNYNPVSDKVRISMNNLYKIGIALEGIYAFSFLNLEDYEKDEDIQKTYKDYLVKIQSKPLIRNRFDFIAS